MANKLDREEISQYNLIIQAVDNYEYGFSSGESRKAFEQIFVKVLDVNDETPIIDPLNGCAMVSEFLPLRETVAFITAKDKDDANTPNGKIKFSIISGNDQALFNIEPVKPMTVPLSSNSISESSARIFSQFSLRMKVGNYSLKIKAEDEGFPPRSSTINVDVCVIDVNDRNPVFVYPPSNFTIRIPENSTLGTHIIQVNATDDDFGMNALVNYKLRELPNGHWKSFSIDSKTGLITLIKPLDREKQRVHEVRVEAYDLGEPTSLSTDLDLTILVTNVDDFEPEFTQDQFEVQFTENLFPGIESFKLVSTIDKDEVDDPQDIIKSIPCYHIVGGNEDEKFNLDPVTHELTATSTLDREENKEYSLIVKATNDCLRKPKPVSQFDSKDNSLLQVVVKVKDVNDNSPKFVKSVFTGGVTTETDFGTIFMSVKVSNNAFFTFNWSLFNLCGYQSIFRQLMKTKETMV